MLRAARAKFAFDLGAVDDQRPLPAEALQRLRQQLGLALRQARRVEHDQLARAGLGRQRVPQARARGTSCSGRGRGCAAPAPCRCRRAGRSAPCASRAGRRRCPSGGRSSWSSSSRPTCRASNACRPGAWRAASARRGAGCRRAARARRSRRRARSTPPALASSLITSSFISSRSLRLGGLAVAPSLSALISACGRRSAASSAAACSASRAASAPRPRRPRPPRPPSAAASAAACGRPSAAPPAGSRCRAPASSTASLIVTQPPLRARHRALDHDQPALGCRCGRPAGSAW